VPERAGSRGEKCLVRGVIGPWKQSDSAPEFYVPGKFAILLGRGYWHESDLLAPRLPVTLHAFDLRPAAVPQPLTPVGAFGKGLNWPAAPGTLWLHEFDAKPGTTVLAKAGSRPAIVIGSAGRGRVGVVAVTPLGEPAPGTAAWWDWPDWPAAMANFIDVLLR